MISSAKRKGTLAVAANIVKAIIRPIRPSYWSDRREAIRQNQAMVDFYRQFISVGDLCFDVGANMGNRTNVFLRLGARVVAVEPQPSCVQVLQRSFGKHPRFTLISSALGAQPGEAELYLAAEPTISSMSRMWIEEVKKSGRFSNHEWSGSLQVSVTTLEDLVKRFGTPSFIKIDVEGYEVEVIRGLHSPARTISFEFVPELLSNVESSLAWLSSLGPVECNYSLGESMQFALPHWLSAGSLLDVLQGLPDRRMFGDVYVRYCSE